MSKIRGEGLMLFFRGKSIALATNHVIDITSENSTESTKDDGHGKWQNNEIRYLNWSATSDNVYSLDGEGNLYGDLFDKMVNCEVLDIVFAKKLQDVEDVPTGGWSPAELQYRGKCIISDLALNAPHDEYATFTVQFTGVGELYKTFIFDANISDPDPVACDDPDSFVLEQNGAAYNYKVYYLNIRRIDGSFSDSLAKVKYHIDDWNDVTENGLQVGNRIHIINVYFQLNDELRTNEYGDIYGVVTALDSTNNIIELKPDDIFKNYFFVNTDFEYDIQSDYQDLMTDGVQLPIEDYPNLVEGEHVYILLNHHYAYLWGKVNGQINNNWKIKPYFITD